MTTTADGWTVLTALPHTAAVLLHGALTTEGITARLDREALSGIYGLDSGGFATRVLVSDTDIGRARSVVAELETSP